MRNGMNCSATALALPYDTPHTSGCARWMLVTVAVVSTVAGHSFPTGFTAERQLWVAIEVRDPEGRLVFASGNLDDQRAICETTIAIKLSRIKFPVTATC